MPKTCFWLYRLFVYPILWGVLFVLSRTLPTNHKLKVFFNERIARKGYPPTKKSVVIHASSGEIEYARALIRELKSKFPDSQIIVSYSSISAKRLLEGISEIDFYLPSPFDFSLTCKSFLKSISPQIVIFARTDVWPEFTYQCRRLSIPTLLLGATFSQDSSRIRFPMRELLLFTLNLLDKILLVSTHDQEVLSAIGLKKDTFVLGDPRFDQVHFRLQRKRFHSVLKNPVFILASTWPEDEEIWFPAVSSVVRNMDLIWAPHEIHSSHIDELLKKMATLGVKVTLWSQINKNKLEWDGILLIDEVGVLADLYSLADLAFVGGSFRKKVHSVMEALGAGVPVLVGPKHTNNQEALRFKKILLNEVPCVKAVHNSEEARQALQDFLILWQKGEVQELKGLLKKRFIAELGATAKSLVLIEELLVQKNRNITS